MTNRENIEPDARNAPSKATTIAFGGMGALFVFAAAVQYNDPDPYLWALLYLASAGVSFASVRMPGAWKAAAAVAAVALIWAATLVPEVLRTSFPELFQSWAMMSKEMEEGREFVGLVMVAVWASYLVYRGRSAQ